MKRFLNEKLLIIVFLLIIIFIFPQIIYAAVDGKKEGVTGTYYDVVSKKENKVSVEKGQGNGYRIKADKTRPIYQYDELSLKIHVRRKVGSGKFKPVKTEYNKEQMEVQVVSFETDYNKVNEADISIKIRILKSGTITCVLMVEDTKLESVSITIKDVKSYSEEFEAEKRESWGVNYHEAKVFDVGKGSSTDTKVNGIIQGRYSETNSDESKTDKKRDPIYSYEIQSDSGWTSYDLGTLKTGIKQRELIVGTTAIEDFGRVIKKGDKFTCKYTFYYIEDKDKLIYRYSREKIQTANGESVTDLTGQKNSETFDELSQEDENTRNTLIKKLSMTSDQGSTRTDLGYFNDVIDDIDYYKPGDISDDDAGVVESRTGNILAIITNIAMVVAVIVPAVLGVKYMLGSVEERADYKKDMIPYFVGAVLIFGISLVVKIVQQFGNTINSL